MPINSSSHQGLKLIVAMGKDHSIGSVGKMPWHLPEDLKHFQMLTLGSPLIMGRKTFESLGRVLKERPHFVVTSATAEQFHELVSGIPNSTHQLVVRCVSLEDACEKVFTHVASAPFNSSVNSSDLTSCFLIGGAQVYREALRQNLVSEIFVTEIDEMFPHADTFFPEIDSAVFERVEMGPQLKSLSGLSYQFVHYVRHVRFANS